MTKSDSPMKDHIFKGKNHRGPDGDAEVAAFRALVSRNFDNSAELTDTESGLASASDALGDSLEAEGQSGVAVDSGFDIEGLGSAGPSIHLSPAEVHALAAQALDVLANAPGAANGNAPLTQLMALTEAYIALEEESRHDLLARIMKRGVSSQDVIEEIIPATARYLGELWASDKLSFAEVTIGAARLQETVRTIGIRRVERDAPIPDGPAIMLVVPRIEQHTLGIFVVAEQFRRMGMRVHMTLGNNQAEILRLVRIHHFAMVGVTASCRRTLASVRDLVKTIRTGVPRIIPIVVGGPVTESNLDIIGMTGADHVATSAEQALRLCEIETTQHRRLES